MRSSTAVSKLALYLSWLIAFILVLLPFHAFLTVWLAGAIGHYTLLRLWKEFFLVVLVLGAAYLLLKDSSLRRKFFSSLLIRLILIYCAFSLIWAIGAYELDKVNLKALAYGILVNSRFLIFFLVTWVVATKSQWLKNNWKKLLLFPALGVVVIGLVQRLFLPYDVLKHFGYNENTIYPFETINHNVHYPRVMSTMRGANPLGAYLIVILSALSALLAKVKKNRYSGAVFAGGALAVLLFSYSREAWIGLAISGLLLGWIVFRKQTVRRELLIACGLALIAGTAVVVIERHNPAFQNVFFHTQSQSSAKESSNHAHASAFKNGLRDAVRQPLGKGVGSAGPASVYNNHPARISENYYIQIAQETGWLGLGLFIAISYLVARELWRRRSDVLALALLVSFAGLVIVNMLSHAWTDDTLAYIWWGFAGVALALKA